MAEVKEKMDIFKLAESINKSLKMEGVQVISSSKGLDIPRLSTGSISYDIATGGGFGIGRHNTLYGAESSGKSTVSLMGLKEYQKSGDERFALVMDSEFAFDKKYALALGVDLTKVLIVQPDHLDEGHDVLMLLLRDNNIGYFIIDSIAALLPKSVLENPAEASNIGKHAMAIGNMFKQSNSFIGKNKVTGVWINQIRDSIGGYGGGVSIPAGHAPKFYSSIMIQVMRGTKVDNGDGTFTNRGKIRVTKNKTFPPYKEAEYDMEHGSGISLAQEVLDYGVESRVIYKKGNSFYYDETFVNDEEKRDQHVNLGKSKAIAKQTLNDNPELTKTLKELILKAQFED